MQFEFDHIEEDYTTVAESGESVEVGANQIFPHEPIFSVSTQNTGSTARQVTKPKMPVILKKSKQPLPQ